MLTFQTLLFVDNQGKLETRRQTLNDPFVLFRCPRIRLRINLVEFVFESASWEWDETQLFHAVFKASEACPLKKGMVFVGLEIVTDGHPNSFNCIWA